MQRVMIIGQPGSGKSTLARALGVRTGLPVFHMDQIHYLPGWVERERAEKTRLCQEVHVRDQWIFEGGHSFTWPERVARCDTLIWMDLSTGLHLWRVLRRSVTYYGRSRPDLTEGCHEQLDPKFYAWIWQTRRTARAKMLRVFKEAPFDKAKIHRKDPHAVCQYLAKFDGQAQT